VTPLVFFTACLLFVFVGLVALDHRSSDIAEWVGEPHAYCARVRRSAAATLVYVPLGTPSRVMKLVLRLDRAFATAASATRIFSDEILRSTTLRCDENRTCSDAALLVVDAHGVQRRLATRFQYEQSSSADVAREQQIGADGSMSLVAGYTYQLSRTHLCFTNASVELSGRGDASTGKIDETTHIVDVDSLTASPGVLSTVPAASCANRTVELFPHRSLSERGWLALSSDFLFESFSAQLDQRRAVVEQGIGCSEESTSRALYELDCDLDAASDCRVVPSVPFRRVSRADVGVCVGLDGATSVVARNRDALKRLVGASPSQDALFFAIIRLVVLIIVAFVVFNRAERSSTSAHSVISTAFTMASGEKHNSHSGHSLVDAMGDAVVGVLAIASRALVIGFQAQVLVDDGHFDVVTWECIGIFASTLHFALRNFVLRTDLKQEAPLTKLGGSMSLADASIAALLSVVTTPLLSAPSHDFDAIARLFCAALVALFVVARGAFASAACALLSTTTASDSRYDPAYPFVLALSSVLWLVQASAVAFSLGRFYALPQAISLSRFSPGDERTSAVAVLLGTLILATPAVNAVTARVSRTHRAHSGLDSFHGEPAASALRFDPDEGAAS
jgi:hypothetical protein